MERAGDARADFLFAIAEETKVPVVFHGVLSYGAKHAGRYTRKDVFDLCPFENTVVLMDLSPSECKAVLEEQRAAFRSKKKNAMPQGNILKPILLIN